MTPQSSGQRALDDLPTTQKQPGQAHKCMVSILLEHWQSGVSWGGASASLAPAAFGGGVLSLRGALQELLLLHKAGGLCMLQFVPQVVLPLVHVPVGAAFVCGDGGVRVH